MRQAILYSLNHDVYCLTETHLKQDTNIELNGYCWFGHNRSIIHIRARKGSGGTGVFVKNSLLDTFYVDVVDKSIDGILGIQFVDKLSKYTIILFSCYLPPDNSSYASNVNDYFAHLSSKVYLHCNADIFMLCGDFNARVGNMKDTILCDKGIPERKIIDVCHSNVHGEIFIDFLLENNLCILNGRLTPELDDFTSISVRGKAVVDYFVTRHDCFESFSKAHVSTTTGLLDKFNLYDLIDNNCKPPDHSVISVILDYTALHDNCEETYTLRTVNNVNMNDMVVCKQKRYHFIDIPNDFQNNDTWKRSTSLFIDKCIYLQMNKLYT